MAIGRNKRRTRLPRPLHLDNGRHGGHRPGAGRPRTSSRVAHLTRAPVKSGHPILVSVRLVDGLPSLRRKDLLRIVYRAIMLANRGAWMRIVHFCVLKNHVHMLVEAQGRDALSRGMQGFSIRMSKAINGALRRAGSVFTDRYNGQVLTTPRRVRHAINYVLQNHRRHGWHARGHRGSVLLDPYSSAEQFDGFAGPITRPVYGHTHPPTLPHPGSWLLREGYRRAGGRIPITLAPKGGP